MLSDTQVNGATTFNRIAPGRWRNSTATANNYIELQASSRLEKDKRNSLLLKAIWYRPRSGDTTGTLFDKSEYQIVYKAPSNVAGQTDFDTFKAHLNATLVATANIYNRMLIGES